MSCVKEFLLSKKRDFFVSWLPSFLPPRPGGTQLAMEENPRASLM